MGAHETAWVGFEFLQVCASLAAGLSFLKLFLLAACEIVRNEA